MRRFFLPLLLLSLTNASAALPSAQGQFVHQSSVTPGCNGLVTSSAKLASGDVIFGGNFTQCGAVRANRVVRFDGVNFHSVGSGTENGVNGAVRAVFVDGDKIYVGGEFSKAGNAVANRVAVFDGSTWRSVGRGSSNGIPGVVVRALQIFQGKLYLGGHTESFSQPILHEWNGATWREALSFTQTNLSDSINAFAVMNNTLYFGGSFQLFGQDVHRNVGILTSNTVSYVDFLPSNPANFSRVRDLHVYQNQLCVAGTFSLGANLPGGVACRTPNGWQAYGLTGMRALADDGTTLYAAGFDDSGLGSVYALGQGSFVRTERSQQDFVLTLAMQGNSLLVGGSFAQTLTPAHGLLRLSQGQFLSVHAGSVPNLSSPLQQLVANNGVALAHSIFNQPHPAPAPSLLRRVGNRWNAIAAPTATTEIDACKLLQTNNGVFLADTSQGELYRWNSGWEQIGANIAVTQSYGDGLIAVDWPNVQGVREVRRLGKNGMEPFFQIPALRRNGELLAGSVVFPLTVVEFGGKPVIAGQFDEIVGYGPIHGVAILEENGWHQLGGGLRDPKWTETQRFLQVQLLAMNNQLYAAGGFTEAEGTPVDGIARFDGTRWQPLGAGLVQSNATAGRAQANLIAYHGKLYAYGKFDLADNQAVHNIAQWDGTQWRALGPASADGIEDPGPFTASVVGDELHLSGEIHAVGGQPAEYYAIWRDDLMFASGFE